MTGDRGLDFVLFMAAIVVLCTAFGLAFEPLRDWADRRELARRMREAQARFDADMQQRIGLKAWQEWQNRIAENQRHNRR